MISNHALTRSIIPARGIQTLIDNRLTQRTRIARHTDALKGGRTIWHEHRLTCALILYTLVQAAHVNNALTELTSVACWTQTSE